VQLPRGDVSTRRRIARSIRDRRSDDDDEETVTRRHKRSIAGRAQPRGVTARLERVQILTTTAEKARWQAAAADAGRTLSDWARMLLNEASKP
jgi:hypothetical protein